MRYEYRVQCSSFLHRGEWITLAAFTHPQQAIQWCARQYELCPGIYRLTLQAEQDDANSPALESFGEKHKWILSQERV